MSKADDNYKRLRAELDRKLSEDKRLGSIADKIAKGTADFTDTAKYTHIVSHHMGKVISENIGKITARLGKEAVCKELLRDHYDLINGVFGEVQVSIDEKLGIHLQPVKPAYPTERVDTWAHSLEDPTVDQSVIERRGQSGAENIGNSMHDDCVKENAKWRDKAGLDTYLVRDAGGGCCAWCAAIAGRYKYADAPEDVFRRHDHCTCTVTYECGKMRQDVWSKESNWSKKQSQEYMRQHDAALAEKRKELRAKGVNVSNAKLNKEEIEAIKARIDASEASKPTVNTPEQAKELERQALEKNPVTKLTPELAKAIDEQSKPVVHTPAEAKELEQKVLAENPITKNTPEQAAELEKQMLESKDNVNKESVDNFAKGAILEGGYNEEDIRRAITQKGTNFVTKDTNNPECIYGELAELIPPDDRYYDIKAHGSPDSVKIFDSVVDAHKLAEIILRREDYNNKPIRLLCCETGKIKNGTCVAKELAELLGVEVSAPTEILHVSTLGNVKIVSENGIKGKMVSFFPDPKGV